MSIESHFHAIDTFLLQWQWLWREVPFKQPALSWFESHPHWKAVIDAIDDDQLQRLALDAEALYAFAREQLLLDIDPVFFRIDATTTPAPYLAPADGISVRKWQQIQALVAALQRTGDQHPPQKYPANLVEWCAGKGHLSRALLQQHLCTSATGLEWDAALINSGMKMARRDNIVLQLHQQNVLHDDVKSYCATDSRHIALHACGNLHISMLQHCCEGQVESIDLVPCCYHKIEEPIYQPLSLQAQRSSLRLDDEALKLALQETVTAPANARRTRERLQQWRLGFDALQRELRCVDDYLPVPSMPGAVANSSFRDFCQRCATLKQLQLPDAIDYDRFESAGIARFGQVSRYDLLRQLFRRPVELWLALDRCLFLSERGYRVELKEFCTRDVTPRNLWIHARHRRHDGVNRQ